MEPDPNTRGPSRMRPNVPMAIQVANQLRWQLRREYADGGRLPGEVDLAARMGVSRGTVRQALAILQHEGLISRRQGAGTFANPHVLGIPARIDFAYEFSELIRACGYEAEVETLEQCRTTATATAASALHIELEAPVLRLRKLYRASGLPAIYEEDLVPMAVIGQAYDPVELERPVWHFLERRCNRRMKYVLSDVECGLAEGELAQLLGVASGSPVLQFFETSYDARNEPLVLSRIYFRQPLIRFQALRKVTPVT